MKIVFLSPPARPPPERSHAVNLFAAAREREEESNNDKMKRRENLSAPLVKFSFPPHVCIGFCSLIPLDKYDYVCTTTIQRNVDEDMSEERLERYAGEQELAPVND